MGRHRGPRSQPGRTSLSLQDRAVPDHCHRLCSQRRCHCPHTTRSTPERCSTQFISFISKLSLLASYQRTTLKKNAKRWCVKDGL